MIYIFVIWSLSALVNLGESIVVCPATDEGTSVYYPVSDCTKFCECSNGTAYLHSCPEGLYFNTTLNACDWPENSGCATNLSTTLSPIESPCSDQETTTETSSTTEASTESSNICVEENIVCPAEDGEDSVYFSTSDCTKFCQCSNGVAYEHDCPAGLHFNSELNVCDWPEDAGCESSSTNTTTTEATTEDDTTTISSTTEAATEDTTTATASTTDATNDDTTTTTSSTTEASTESSNICVDENIVCPAEDGEDSVYFPVSDCTKFCQCSNGVAYEHDCPAGLHFNSELNVCDWPEDAGCESSSTNTTTTEATTEDDTTTTSSTTEAATEDTTTATASTTEASTESSSICVEENIVCPAEDGEDSVYFSTSDCTKFCQCSNGVAYEHDCPAGLHFNSDLNVCDWPEDAGCESSSTNTTTTEATTEDDTTTTSSTTEAATEDTTTATASTTDATNDNTTTTTSSTTEASTESSSICVEENIVCPAEDGEDSVYFSTSDCTKFCQCSNGVAYEHDCPAGLHFNSDLNVCDWPEDAGCESSSTNTTTTEATTEDDTTTTSSTTEAATEDTTTATASTTDATNDNTTTTTSSTTEASTESSSICVEENIVCPAEDGEDSVYFSTSDCTKFCQCSNGVAYEHDCPAGLHFNSELNVCDWPEDAGCESSSTNTTTTEATTEDDTTTISSTTEAATEDDTTTTLSTTEATTEDDTTTTSSTTEAATEDTATATASTTDAATEDSTTTTSSTTEASTESSNICVEENIVCPAEDGEDSVYFSTSDCTKFCQCSNGVAYEHNCPAGLHFNSELNVCDWPEDAGCESSSTNTTTTEATTEDDTTTTSSTTEAATEDTTTATASTTDATNDNTTTTTSSTTEASTESSSICVEENIVCPAEDGEDSVYFSTSDCTKFCQCSNGVAYEHDCPAGLHFNSELNVCDWPEDAGCESSSTNTTTTEATTEDDTTTTSSTTEAATEDTATATASTTDAATEDSTTTTSSTTEASTESSNICVEENIVCPAEDGEDSVYFSTSDCTKFCQCSNGVAYEHDCPAGLHFNSELNVCDWPEDAGCESSSTNTTTTEATTEDDTTTTSSTTEATTEDTTTAIASTTDAATEDSTTTTSSTTESSTESSSICVEENIVCPAEDGEDSVYFSTSDCTKFCQCSNGVAYEHDCPAGLHFNSELNVCDWPEDAGCESSSTNTTTTEATTEDDTTTTSSTTEAATEDSTTATASTTDATNDDTTTTTSSTTEASTESSNICVEENIVCPAEDGEDSVYFSTSDCTKFCQCSNGVAYEHDCPAGLHFNSELNVCDWPEDAGCESSSTNTTTTEATTEDDTTTTSSTTEAATEDSTTATASTTDATNDDTTTTTSSTTEASTESSNICVDENIVCPAEDGEDSVYFPVSDCTKFCQCSNGVAYEHNCPAGLHFNSELNVCDWPEDAGCESSSTTTITSN
ncbi:mucin-22-like isoform X2 [Diorhabda carinulata]|uniref:mucin-22-like isoform X2 n=1 Tax=Diorhabda carinulata TaxID=1163345 RepID=UPI0025A16358|nr:mucin-22-like isoform X2 [Diorhabda carinulata]